VGGDTEEVLLLDGQQRLATSMILLAAMRDAFRPIDGDSAGWIQQNYLSNWDPIKQRLIHKLRLNVYDRDFFQRLISEKREAGYVAPEPQHASHRLIADAKAYFDTQVSEMIQDRTEAEALAWLRRAMTALTDHFTVIAASSQNEDNAAEVFETLNDRGIGLSTPDLLRNLIIRRGGQGQHELIVERWEDVIAFETDTQIKTFLRHFWISRYGDVKTQSLYREVKSTVEENAIDSVALSTDLQEAARLYRRLRRADMEVAAENELLIAIDEIGAGTAILFPCLLSIFDTLSGADRLRAIRALLNVYVRDGIIGGIENSVLENRLHSAARNLRQSKDVGAFCVALAENALVDDEVRNRFERLSITQNGPRRYLLRMLEMAKRSTQEIEVAAPARVHVEHIYPQTPLQGQRWQSHNAWVNRLGNLTLLDRSLNAAIKNGVFAAKRPSYERSELLMTRELAALDGWDSGKVATRQSELAGLVAGIWPLVD